MANTYLLCALLFSITIPSYNGETVNVANPPVNRYTVDLDTPPMLRWLDVITGEGKNVDVMIDMVQYVLIINN
jgi:hypothetical protein